MAQQSFYYLVWKEGDHYVSQCMNVDVSSFGDSREEALTNLNEALELYFEDDNSSNHVLIESPEIVPAPKRRA